MPGRIIDEYWLRSRICPFSSPLQCCNVTSLLPSLAYLLCLHKNPLADKGGKVMFLGRESEVTGKITSLKQNASKIVLLKNGVSHIDVKKISDCLCSVSLTFKVSEINIKTF